MGAEAEVPERATALELETITRLSRQTIYKHAKRAQIVADAEHRFPVREVLEAIVRHQREDKRLKTTPIPKSRKLELETALLETRLRQAEGDLIDAKKQRRQTFQLARRLRDRILGGLPRVSAMLVSISEPAQIERILNGEFRGIFDQYSQDIRREILGGNVELDETAGSLDEEPG